MEERMLDDEDERLIKLKRTKEGDVDAVDAEIDGEGEAEEQEIYLDFPEDEEYDEGLVGLTAEQLKKERARREQLKREAQEKHDELVSEAEEKLSAGDFAEAEAFFEQATVYVADSFVASCGVWRARTQNFTDLSVFYDEDYALEVAQSTDEVKAFIREKVGERLEADRKQLEEQAAPIRERFRAAQAERRGAFVANRNYYLVRTLIVLACMVATLVGMGVSISMLATTLENTPIICTICFAAASFALLVVLLALLRKLFLALSMCRANEKLSSTKEGEQLAEIEEKLSCLRDVLDDDVEYED